MEEGLSVTKWVYRNKKDERGVVVRNKARLVAQGHRQEEGIDMIVFALRMATEEKPEEFEFANVKTAIQPMRHRTFSPRMRSQAPDNMIVVLWLVLRCLKSHTDDNVADTTNQGHLMLAVPVLVDSIGMINPISCIQPPDSLQLFILWLDTVSNQTVPKLVPARQSLYRYRDVVEQIRQGTVTPFIGLQCGTDIPTRIGVAPSERPSEAQPTPSPAHTSEVPFEPQLDSSPAHTSEVPFEPQLDSSPAHISEVPIEPQTDPSPRPSPTIIPDSNSPKKKGFLVES
ncbi:copia protein [Tanacetum coccineum]